MDNPIVIYKAIDNWEAQFVRVLLEQEGIEAMAVDDLSVVGLMTIGTLPGIHQPKVYVDRSQGEAAAAIVRQYVERLQQERGVSRLAGGDAAAVEAICEKCGKKTTFKASQRGTIQECRHCGAYLDAGGPPTESGDEENRGDASDGEMG